MKSPNPNSGIYEADTSRTLDLNGGNPSCNQGGMIVVGFDSYNIEQTDDTTPTLTTRGQQQSNGARVITRGGATRIKLEHCVRQTRKE